MGSQTDEAERRVQQQRALIERKVEDLEHRLGEDVQVARERVTHHATHLPDLFPGGQKVMEQAQEHPMATLAGSVGLGVALGMMGGGHGGGGDSDSHAGHQHDSNGRSAMGAAGGMLSGLGATMMSPLRPYIEDMARDVFQGFADRRQQQASDRAREESRSEEGRSRG